MKNLLVPAAIAIGGLLFAGQSIVTDCTNSVDSLNHKHDRVTNRTHARIHNKNIAQPEIQANAILVADFTPVSEKLTESYFIDFPDNQVNQADMEINKQMQENLVVISLQDASSGDIEIIEQMQKSLVIIETPVLQNADQYIERQFAEDEASTLKFVADEDINRADKDIQESFKNALS